MIPPHPGPAYIEKVDERGDLKVWIVDGAYIRGHIDEEFANFGQHYRYPYIPVNELWVDCEAEHDERQFFIDHLLVEPRLMVEGMGITFPAPRLKTRNCVGMWCMMNVISAQR